MNPFYKISKVFLLITLFMFAGCYEGSKKAANPSNGAANGKPGAGGKPYGLVILDVIRPSEDALSDARCGNVPVSLVEIRKQEMDARIDSVQTLLGSMATTLKVYTTSILASDCQKFRALVKRAQMSIADGYDVDTLIDKPALHVRLVLWYGDSSTTWPDNSVLASRWAEGTKLDNLGFDPIFSVNHFVLSSSATGYIWNWQKNSNANNDFAASVVVDPIPTDDGLKQIAAAVQDSAIAFAHWLNVRTATYP